MSQKAQILIVDDIADNRLMLNILLSDDYEIVEAASGRECFEQIEARMPSIILLDVDMPEMSGYQVCERLRKQKDTESLPIIFVSALDSTEERLAGFEAGGDEYVIKPVDGDELEEKVRVALDRHQDVVLAKQSAAQATAIAMEAMTSGSELGQIIEFVKSSQTIQTIEEVGGAICKVASNFGLQACVLLNGPEYSYVGCSADSLEGKLLDNFKTNDEKLVNAGIRLIVRSDQIVCLIKNMPLEDENRYGRLKDHFAMLVDIANGRVLTLQVQLAMAGQREELLRHVITLAEKQIKKSSTALRIHDEKIRSTMQNMLDELGSMLFGLGLDEDQERALMDLADKASLDLSEANESTVKVDAELGSVLEALYGVLEGER